MTEDTDLKYVVFPNVAHITEEIDVKNIVIPPQKRCSF